MDSSIWTLVFWKRVLENDIHVFAGGMLGVLSGKALGVDGLVALPWHSALDTGLFAVVISTLMTLASQSATKAPLGSFVPPKGE